MFKKQLKTNKVIIDTLSKIATGSNIDPSDGNHDSMAIVQSLAAKERLQSFIPLIVDKLGTELSLPETAVVTQDNIPDDVANSVMFFINKGTCTVQVNGVSGKDPITICELEEGEHFGEIHLIWNCARTATVISNNYNTLARLKRDNFEDLVADYPEFETLLKKHVLKVYAQRTKKMTFSKDGVLRHENQDPRFKFLRDAIKRVPYLENIDEACLFDIIFALTVSSEERGAEVLGPEDKTTALMILAEGLVDVFTTFESNEFIVDKLGRGTVLNHRTFFKKDLITVSYRCSKDCRIYSLDVADMKDIIAKYSRKRFMKVIDRYQNKIVKQTVKYPLDYISVNPAEKKIDRGLVARSSKLKNTIMSVVLKNRGIKNRPKLSDFMRIYAE